MASTSDIRDIMNLGQAGPRQPAPKKKKTIENQPRVTGVRREVQALMGDSVPPIAIVEQRSYKSRPSISQKLFKPRHWEERTFQHGGRSDGLVLRHWKRSIPGSNARAPVVANGSADVEMTDDVKTVQELMFEDEYPSHKWNIKVQVPTYTDEQYDTMLKSEDWTRQETDYLIDLCREYDLRWIIIADRYNTSDIPSPIPAPQPVEPPTTDLVTKLHYPPRTMESLKQRYYAIAASLMEQTTPASTMTATEFQLWEKMRTFDAKTETMRKAMAEKLFERTKDEADEERILLEELHRITKNEDDFIKMRRDLYARLEPVAPLRRSGNGEEQSTAMYQTSGGLSMLLQTLLAKEKRLKRPTLPDGTAGPSTGTPTDARAEKARQSSQYGRRDTLDTQATADEPQKKGSVSQAPTVRILSPADAAKFGVSHPQERLTSGVQFRHEKINRLTMAKSQTQTTKIQAALTELGIPARLLMPTERVCREFERLVGEINILLDCRKVGEKVSSEVKVLEEMRRVRLGLPKDGDEVAAGASTGNAEPKDVSSFPNTTDAMEIDDSQIGDTSKVNESVVPEEDEDAEAEEDDEPAETAQKADGSDEQNDDSAMQAETQADDDDDADEDEDADESAAAVKPVEEDEDDEEDQDDEEVTGLDNDEDQEDDDDDEDDGPQLNVDDDDDEEDEEEEEVAATPQEDSDAEEEEADSDDEAEAAAAAQAQAEAEASSSAESEDDAEADINEDDSDAEAQAQAAAEASSEEESDQGADQDDEDDGPSAPQANESDEDEDDAEEEAAPEPEPEPEPVPAVRAHKRSASVVSEASRAGSNRSGMGRKKRR